MPNPSMPQVEWRRVSGKYLVAELLTGIIWTLLLGGIAAVLYFVLEMPWYAWIWPAVFAGFALLGVILGYLRVRSIGYALREDDFLVRRGVLLRRTVAVPYGRMQLVDMKQGPMLRMLGLASVQLVTAAASTAAEVPGLARADAERLRDHLVRLAETRRAGL